MTVSAELQFSLLDEPLIRYRSSGNGDLLRASLPQLFAALAANQVRDFPALRPHQRHPWHAFLAQLAAIAMHQADVAEPFSDAADWRQALLNLTPDDGDGAAWCLVTPAARPALLQSAVPDDSLGTWSKTASPDELDMLITSKNHDLKARRATKGSADDWLFALVSLQTQEGYGGRDNFGISRMSGGFGSRVAIEAVERTSPGARWQRAVKVLLHERSRTASDLSMLDSQGTALLWLLPWDESGTTQVPFAQLDPLYIEVCRKVRLTLSPDGHPKLLHSWPPKVLQAGRVNYAGSEAMARRAEASFRR